MSALRPDGSTGMRRSHKVALVLLGTTGVIGLATAWDAWRKAGADEEEAAPTAPVPPVSTDRTYTNNEFVPGAGYYHAPYHAWYPYPYNYHDPARGYFAGGFWQALPWILAVNRSQPNPESVTSALAAQRRYEEEQRQRAATRSFGSSGFRGGSGYSSARPAGAPMSKPSIIRGGFGSSGHSGGS